MRIKLQETKDIKQYRLLFDGLFKDFNYALWDGILMWCDIKYNSIAEDRYWRVFLIKKRNIVIGICGLYSMDHDTDELWLGWFGILPEYRNKGIGKIVLQALEKRAKIVGCKYIYSHVGKNNFKAMRFYEREGFERISTVLKFIKNNKVDRNEFENINDHVIRKIL